MYLLFSLKIFSVATDFEKKGVWVHDNDDSNELQWINHKWNCDGNGGTHQFYSHGGDAILLGIRNGLLLVNGAWCDWESSSARQFICEGFMLN